MAVYVSGSVTSKNTFDINKISDDIIAGNYGSGQTRIQNLKNEGYNDSQISFVQSVVNQKLGSNNFGSSSSSTSRPSSSSTTKPSSYTNTGVTTKPSSSAKTSVTTKPSSYTSTGVTTKPSSYTNTGVTTKPSSSVKPSVTTKPSSYTNTGVTTKPSSSAKPSVTTKPSSYTNTGVTTKPSSYTSTSVTTKPSSYTNRSVTTKPSSYTNTGVTTKPSSSAKPSVTTKPSSYTNTGVTTKPSSYTNTGVTTKPSSYTNTGVTIKPSSYTNRSVTTKPSSYTSTSVTTKSSSYTNAGVTTKPSSYTNTGVTTKPSSYTNTGVTTKPSSYINTGVTTKPSSYTNTGVTTKPSSYTNTGVTTKPSSYTNTSVTTKPSSYTSTSVTTKPSSYTTPIVTTKQSTSNAMKNDPRYEVSQTKTSAYLVSNTTKDANNAYGSQYNPILMGKMSQNIDSIISQKLTVTDTNKIYDGMNLSIYNDNVLFGEDVINKNLDLTGFAENLKDIYVGNSTSINIPTGLENNVGAYQSVLPDGLYNYLILKDNGIEFKNEENVITSYFINGRQKYMSIQVGYGGKTVYKDGRLIGVVYEGNDKNMFIDYSDPLNPVYKRINSQTKELSDISIFDNENIASKQYGADQMDWYNNFDELMKDDFVWNELQKNFSVSIFESEDKAMEFYESYLHDNNCGYAACVNVIFDQFEGKEQEFEEKFGFPMYTVDNTTGEIDFNYEYMQLIYYEDAVLKNGFEGTNSKKRTDTLTDFLSNYNINLETTLNTSFLNTSKDTFLLNDKIINEDVKAFYDKNGNIIMSAKNYDLYDMNGNLVCDNGDGHAMYVVDFTDDGYPIVSSWGGKYILDIKGNDDLDYFNTSLYTIDGYNFD